MKLNKTTGVLSMTNYIKNCGKSLAYLPMMLAASVGLSACGSGSTNNATPIQPGFTTTMSPTTISLSSSTPISTVVTYTKESASESAGIFSEENNTVFESSIAILVVTSSYTNMESISSANPYPAKIVTKCESATYDDATLTYKKICYSVPSEALNKSLTYTSSTNLDASVVPVWMNMLTPQMRVLTSAFYMWSALIIRAEILAPMQAEQYEAYANQNRLEQENDPQKYFAGTFTQ